MNSIMIFFHLHSSDRKWRLHCIFLSTGEDSDAPCSLLSDRPASVRGGAG
jgi:hypothetical protein